jgi:hypothetical protein
MDPVLQLLTGAGVAGVMLLLFVRGDLATKKATDERITEINKQWSERFNEMRQDRNSWRQLALGTERRLDVAGPTVAKAIGAPLPSPEPDPPGIGQ